MTALLWQTALLLLGAYFLGAWIACFIRRVFFAPRKSRDPMGGSYGEAASHGAGAVAQRAAAITQGPLPATPSRSAALPNDRFARALEGDARAGMPRAPDEDIENRVRAIRAVARAAESGEPAAPPSRPEVIAAPAALSPAASQASAAETIQDAAPRLVLPIASGTSGQSSVAANIFGPEDLPAQAQLAGAVEAHLPTALSYREDLTRISGINSEVERILQSQGIARFSQIAALGEADSARLEQLLGVPGRIGRERWIEQARALASPAGFLDGGSGPGPSSAGGAQDDLKLIRGIGVLIEQRLNQIGIWRYEQIAGWTAPDIARVSTNLDFKDRIEREDWIGQARILASGGGTDFSRRMQS